MHKAYRARSSIGKWFTLTSDDDDDDEEADQVQNAKKRRMVTKCALLNMDFFTESKNLR